MTPRANLDRPIAAPWAAGANWRRKLTRKMRHSAWSKAVLGAAVFALAGAGNAMAETELRVAMTAADIPAIDGAPDQGYEGWRFTGYTLYDALVNWDLSRSDKAADLTGGLAESWNVDPQDNTRWIFHLRHGVSFHDGCAWNADSAMFNINRVLDDTSPQFNQRQAGTARAISFSNVASVEKVDDYTIAFHTKGPVSIFPYDMTGFFMVSNCALEAANYDWDVYAQHPQGTGPYKFESIVPRERLTLVRNADYWDPNRVPKHDKLTLIPMPEAATRAAALLSGQVDFIEAPSPDTIPRLKSAGMQIVTAPYPHNWDYQLNHQSGPFSDLRIRQAANYAINRDEMVEFLGGMATPAYQRLIPSQAWYGDPVKYTYDPEKARALLKEAGCMPCKIRVATSTSGSGQMLPLPMNELMKEYLDAVGFDTQIEVMDWGAVLSIFFGGAESSDFDALNASGAPLEPGQAIIKINTPGKMNDWGDYTNDDVIKMIGEAMSEFDPTKRDAILTRINEQSVADAAEVYVVHDLNPRALSPKLSGFVQAQSWFQDLTPIVVNP